MIKSIETLIAADALNYRSIKKWDSYNIHRANPHDVLDKLYEYKRFFGAGYFEFEINRAIELYRYLCDKPEENIIRTLNIKEIQISKKTLQDYIVRDNQLIKMWD